MGAEEYGEAITTIDIALLNLLGRAYVIDHCVKHTKDKYDKRNYRVYVTEVLRAIYVSVTGDTEVGRYADTLKSDSTSSDKEEEKSAEEIKASICAKLDKAGRE